MNYYIKLEITDENSYFSFFLIIVLNYAQDIINKYGLLSHIPVTNPGDPETEVGINGVEVEHLQNAIVCMADTEAERSNLLLILDCLRMLAIEDGRPLFVWWNPDITRVASKLHSPFQFFKIYLLKKWDTRVSLPHVNFWENFYVRIIRTTINRMF